MRDSRSIQVLVLTLQADHAERIVQTLANCGHAWSCSTDVPEDRQVDVLVTDLSAEELAGRLGRAGGRRAGLPNGSGLVGIGDAPWADVVLAPDYTDRELRMACQSAAQIARLRNQHHELARVHREVAQLAETDPLTGLPNRRAWDSRLPEMLARASRRGETLWLAIVDLDAFKTVNDRDGMQQGDRVLADAGKALSSALRRSDLVARLGGDEFGILLANIPTERVEGVLDRLRAAIRSGRRVTASIGYVAVRPSVASGELLATAEKAMRAAKRAGGDHIERGDLPAAASSV